MNVMGPLSVPGLQRNLIYEGGKHGTMVLLLCA